LKSKVYTALATISHTLTELDAVWRDFIPDVPSVFKDSEESLKVLTDRWDSVFQDALLLTFFNPKLSYHLVFFQDTTTGEALAQLPPGPVIDA
jgi:hypothetical protein